MIDRLDSDRTHVTRDIKAEEAGIFVPYGEFDHALELANVSGPITLPRITTTTTSGTASC